jgi:PadR family transcriptional regulator, regulatory protein PadR
MVIRQISSYSAGMPRRRPGSLLPLELELLSSGVQHEEFHGFAIATEIASGSQRLTAHGTLYKALGRLEAAGLLTSRWEEPAPEGRPRRRLYRVTGEGERAVARAALPASSTAVQRRPGLAT